MSLFMGAKLICYQFSRRNVEEGDFAHFLSLYSLDKLPVGRGLQQMMGTFVFAITGYDDDPRELRACLKSEVAPVLASCNCGRGESFSRKIMKYD